MGQRFKKNYDIHCYDFDKNAKLKPTTLMNFLQDISTIHFETQTKHLGPEVLNGLWVIVEWRVSMDEMPQEVTTLTVTTEPTYFRKFIAYRQYTIEDAFGRILGTAISKWAYIDLASRKQLNIPKVLNDVFEVAENADKPEKLTFIDLMDSEMQTMQRSSVYSDLDVNHHVNNVTYIRWAVDALGGDVLDHYRVRELQVAFKREVFEGEQVTVSSQKKVTTDGVITEHLIKDESGQLCVQIQIGWVPLNEALRPLV